MSERERPWGLAVNVLGNQAVWLAAVAGAGHGRAWPGPVAAVAFAAITLAIGGKRSADLRSLALVLPLGILLDSAFAASGWMRYEGAWPWTWAAPVWIWALWASFALTVNHSLAFLGARSGLAAMLGLLGGPLAYWAAAASFGAVTFGAPTATVLLALGLAWAVTLPLLFRLNHAATAPLAALP